MQHFLVTPCIPATDQWLAFMREYVHKGWAGIGNDVTGNCWQAQLMPVYVVIVLNLMLDTVLLWSLSLWWPLMTSGSPVLAFTSIPRAANTPFNAICTLIRFSPLSPKPAPAWHWWRAVIMSHCINTDSHLQCDCKFRKPMQMVTGTVHACAPCTVGGLFTINTTFRHWHDVSGHSGSTHGWWRHTHMRKCQMTRRTSRRVTSTPTLDI